MTSPSIIAERHPSLVCCLRYAGVALGPIEAIAGIGTFFAALDDQERAVSIMLDLVDPACAGRRMID
jgi:hypothetical protein